MNARTLMLGAALSLCAALPGLAQDTPGAGTVVATVGGTDITLGHMIALRERLPQQYAQLPDDALFDGLLAQLINQEALAQKADGDSPRTDLVLENERRALVANDVLQSVAQGAVTEEAIAQAYDDAYGDAGPTTEWNASHILLETEEDATAVKEELDAGSDFAALARERSTGPSGPNGGSLGWFGPGMMVPQFEEAVGGLQPGEVSEPFQTDFGWHVAKLNEVRESDVPTLEAVREELAAQVQQQALEAAVAAATDGVEVVQPDISGIDPNMLSDSALID
jgi:peptidyl-prolyl cis-trans isomerase C